MKGLQKIRWFLSGLVTAALMANLLSPTLATLTGKMIEVYTGVDIYIDDVKLDPKDANGNPVEAFIYNGTTYLPVRAIGEALGKTVQWEGKTNSVYVGKHTGEKPAVWLKDLDYFTGSAFKTETTDKDNLGQARTNCIVTVSRDNTYRINGQYSLITGTLYQKYDYRSEPSHGFIKIYGDGELLYEAEMNMGIDPLDFSVDIRGVLELRVHYGSWSGSSSWSNNDVPGTAIADCGLWT